MGGRVANAEDIRDRNDRHHNEQSQA